MGLPTQPVTLTVEQIAELNRRISVLRHDINNQLSLIAAAAEIIRFKPEEASRMAAILSEQPPRISENLNKFSAGFDALFGITPS